MKTSQLNVGQRSKLKEIQSILLSREDIFESSPGDLRKYAHHDSSVDGSIIWLLELPKNISPKDVDGFKLKGDSGYISIQETYKILNTRKLERIGYVYRYVNPVLKYSFLHETSGDKNKTSYYYHYDMDLRFTNQGESVSEEPGSPHPLYHLQVLHNFPRFETPKMSVAKFIEYVIESVFNPGFPPYEAHNEAFFSKR